MQSRVFFFLFSFLDFDSSGFSGEKKKGLINGQRMVKVVIMIQSDLILI